MSATPSVSDAHGAVVEAEGTVLAAEAALAAARDQLDVALAAVGWRRLAGAFNPDARLYVQNGRTLPLSQLLAELGRKGAPA